MKNAPNSMDLVKAKIAEYKQALAEIEEKRTLWLSSVKELIFKTLSKVKRTAKLKWKIEKIEGSENLQAVSILFQDLPSGIIENTINEKTQKSEQKSLIKHGGGLVFSQTYNGDILVLFSYPYLEGDEANQGSNIVERVSPDEVTEDFVLSQLASFIETITAWEIAEKEHAIGFRVKN